LNYDRPILRLIIHGDSELASDTLIPLDAREDGSITRTGPRGVIVAQRNAVPPTSMPPA
jgi:hypothetical protein